MSRDLDCWNTVGIRGAATCERLAKVAHCRNCPDYTAAGRRLLDRDVPDGAREEWARLIGEPRESRPASSISVFVFRIGLDWLALKTELLERAVTVRPVHTVPSRSNRIFEGLVNVDGELLLCFSAAAALGLEGATSAAADKRERKRLLVVSREGQRFSFPVDEALGVCTLAPEDFTSVPATLSNAPDAVTVSVSCIGTLRVGLLDEARFFQLLARSVTA